MLQGKKTKSIFFNKCEKSMTIFIMYNDKIFSRYVSMELILLFNVFIQNTTNETMNMTEFSTPPLFQK